MNDAVSRHPEVRTMTAFIEGALEPAEVAAVADHLRGCADCRTIVSETARFEREETRAPRRGRPAAWWWLAAALIAAAVITPLLYRNLGRDATPLADLIDAAPREHRSIEARLSGFPWARLQPPARGTAAADPAELKLAGAAGEVLESTAAKQTSEAQHARGAAYLLIGRRADAIASLEQAAHDSKDPRVWNDLAAARLAVAIDDERTAELPEALAAADRALTLDARSSEALFNRALILERLGIRDQARQAWQQYLAVDGGSEWAVEARAHLRALDDQTQRFDPKRLDPSTAAALVRQFPQETRTWGEGPLLAEWAEAPNDAAPLATARAIGKALAATNGERLLAGAVAAIDAATPAARAALIEGHRLYRDGRMEYSKRNASAAEEKLRQAATLFRQGSSPMADVAEYYVADAMFAQRRGDEALGVLTRLRTRMAGDGHRALGAQIQRSLAVMANADGDWGTGAREADSAAATFRALGETKNAAVVEGIAADAFDMIGGGDLAWSRRIRTCALLTAAEDRPRRATLLRDAALSLDRFGQTEAAVAMIGLAIEDLAGDPALLVAALTDRARLAERGGDAGAARSGLAAARSAAAGVRDAPLRETLLASIDVADAAVRRHAEPHAAVAALDKAIVVFSEGRLRHLLPSTYLERARAHRAAGNEIAAVADYAAALREVNAQRSTIGDASLRLRFLDTASQIVEETIELHLARGSVAEAFRVADGTRELPATRRGSLEPIDTLPAVAAGTAVIEFALLPHATAIFCLSGGQLTVAKVAVERPVLARRIALFAELVRGRAPVAEINVEAGALYRLLIAPMQQRLASVEQIIVIPDRELHAVPFAALYDDAKREYLVEQFTIRFASATSATREIAAGALQPALVMADPPTPKWPRLPASREEGQRIAAMHGTTLVSGAAATRERFLDEAYRSALIHFAGHADSNAGDSYGALLFAAGESDTGILGSSAIAHLELKQHPLVILAACGTFRGDPVHVAGMSSLARAFLLAGARGVVGTLWEVDDDVAARFFLRLHETLRSGALPARAVRTTQIAMIHASDARLRHPASWGPVAFIGT